MAGNARRLVWWIFAGRHPATSGQQAALATLLGLVLLGAFAFAWPWLSTEVPRALGAALALIQALLTELLRVLMNWLRLLTDWLGSLIARLPRFD